MKEIPSAAKQAACSQSRKQEAVGDHSRASKTPWGDKKALHCLTNILGTELIGSLSLGTMRM